MEPVESTHEETLMAVLHLFGFAMLIVVIVRAQHKGTTNSISCMIVCHPPLSKKNLAPTHEVGQSSTQRSTNLHTCTFMPQLAQIMNGMQALQENTTGAWLSHQNFSVSLMPSLIHLQQPHSCRRTGLHPGPTKNFLPGHGCCLPAARVDFNTCLLLGHSKLGCQPLKTMLFKQATERESAMLEGFELEQFCHSTLRADSCAWSV
jgi:hypothetical protein